LDDQLNQQMKKILIALNFNNYVNFANITRQNTFSLSVSKSLIEFHPVMSNVLKFTKTK